MASVPFSLPRECATRSKEKSKTVLLRADKFPCPLSPALIGSDEIVVDIIPVSNLVLPERIPTTRLQADHSTNRLTF